MAKMITFFREDRSSEGIRCGPLTDFEIKHFMYLWFVLLVNLAVGMSSASEFTVTRAHLHESASLPCYHKCSGNLEWITSKDRTVVATCNQYNQCWAKEGFQMSYEQFQKGNLSLTVTSADHSKKCWYIAVCNGQTVCDCSLLIQPVYLSINHTNGEALLLDLLTMNPVKVTFKGVNASGNCTLNGRSLECSAKYKNRVKVLDNSLVLTDLSPLDTGFCTVHEIETEDLVANSTIAVTGYILGEGGQSGGWRNMITVSRDDKQGLWVLCLQPAHS